jgi:hypothetical protein
MGFKHAASQIILYGYSLILLPLQNVVWLIAENFLFKAFLVVGMKGKHFAILGW